MNDQEIVKLIKTNNTGKAMLELYQSLPVVDELKETNEILEIKLDSLLKQKHTTKVADAQS